MEGSTDQGSVGPAEADGPAPTTGRPRHPGATPRTLLREAEPARADPWAAALSCGYLVVGADGLIEACHVSFAAIAGTTPAELVGRRLSDVLDADDELLSSSDRLVQRMSAVLRRADGKRVPLVVRQFARRTGTASGATTWVLVVDAPPGTAVVSEGVGATDGQQRHEEVEDAEIAVVRAAFLRAVAHDLKNPLSIITGMGHTLADRQAELPTEVRVELAEAIARQGGRLLSTLENLLALDRLALGRTQLRRCRTDIAVVIENALSALRDERGRVRTDLDPVTASVDVILVERIIENLVRNAVEHQMTEHPVDIQLRRAPRDPGRFEIRVLDRGPGIDPAEREDIFRPYFRGDRRGVGLSIVRAFARMHGGDVTVNDRPGGGSVFVVSLPVDTAAVQ